MAIDPLLTGESTEDGVAVSAAPVVREGFSGYTYGYNRTLFAKRVHDVLTAVAFVIDTPKWEVEKVHLVGIDPGGGVLALAARAQCGAEPIVGKTLARLDGVRFRDASGIHDPWFVPGAVKYGDVPGLLALCAPGPVLVAGEADLLDLSPAVEAYLATANREALTVLSELDGAAALNWLEQ
jgi:hypothetical protein